MHYSKAQHPTKLKKWADKAAADVEELYNSGYRPILVYTGMSGVSSATALMLSYCALTDINLEAIYVRKDNEVSHGSKLECQIDGKVDWNSPFNALVFVDDFIFSGETAARVLTKVSEFADIQSGDIIDQTFLALTGHTRDSIYRPVKPLTDTSFAEDVTQLLIDKEKENG